MRLCLRPRLLLAFEWAIEKRLFQDVLYKPRDALRAHLADASIEVLQLFNKAARIWQRDRWGDIACVDMNAHIHQA